MILDSAYLRLAESTSPADEIFAWLDSLGLSDLEKVRDFGIKTISPLAMCILIRKQSGAISSTSSRVPAPLPL